MDVGSEASRFNRETPQTRLAGAMVVLLRHAFVESWAGRLIQASFHCIKFSNALDCLAKQLALMPLLPDHRCT